MKDQNRIRFNGSTTPAENQADGNHEETEMFEPIMKLARALRALPAAERRKTIDGMLKACMQFASETGDVGLDRVIHKNLFLLNVGQCEQKELRALAVAFGIQSLKPTPGGWKQISLQISDVYLDEMRLMAKALGWQFRDFIKFALVKLIMETRSESGQCNFLRCSPKQFEAARFRLNAVRNLIDRPMLTNKLN